MATPVSNSEFVQQLSNALNPPLPPVERLAEYAGQLPPIYRDILAAFQSSRPERTEGESVAKATLKVMLLNEGKAHSDDELDLALDQLVAERFLSETRFKSWFAPTRLGEALIAVITGKKAKEASVPALPKPTW
jgi:hypothetical protein